MIKSSKPLAAEPADLTPDVGPRHRGGPFALFVALFCAMSALGVVLLLWRKGYQNPAAAIALILGSISAWAAWCLVERWHGHPPLPLSHRVLSGHLAFDIRCTCRDVAAAVFFDPDRLSSNAPTQLLCFLENYASRRRIAHVQIGPHRKLGLDAAITVSLELAAGEAAVYALPLTTAATLEPGEHDLPITLQVTKPNGTGARLPGTSGFIYDLWTIHFAAPFTVTAANAPAAGRFPIDHPQPRYLALASLSDPAPRLHILNTLLAPTRPTSA